MHDLSESLDGPLWEHFTHYDYLLQLIENGQVSALKDHVKLITSKSLVQFLLLMPAFSTYREIVIAEILKRMK